MEENLIDRIGDEYLNPNFQDGQILLNSDVNEIVSIVKEGINANFNDIQKIQNGSLQVGNSSQLDGATLTKFSDGELEGADNKIPTAQLVKSYVDNKVQEVKDTTEVGQLVENFNNLVIEVGDKVDKEDLVSEETAGTDKAYNCDYINELFESGVGDSLPIGTIVEYDGNNIPDGFEEVVEPQDATVYVGPTEPTDGQDVWIQKSVNMLNKNNPLIVHAYPDGNTKSWLFDNNGYSFVVEIESNSEYVITKPSGANIFNISTSTSMPTSGGSATNLVDGTNNEIHIRSGANDKYLIGYFAWSGEAIDVAALLNGVQVQKGSVATSYEPYTDKKIFVKNDNGTYDEFYKDNGIVESGKNENGSYVKYADGTMICRHRVSLGSCTFKLNESGLYTSSPGYYAWSFPMPFIDSDVNVHPTCQSGAYMCSSVGWLINNAINIFYHTNYACTTDVNLYMTAIGKWK